MYFQRILEFSSTHGITLTCSGSVFPNKWKVISSLAKYYFPYWLAQHKWSTQKFANTKFRLVKKIKIKPCATSLSWSYRVPSYSPSANSMNFLITCQNYAKKKTLHKKKTLKTKDGK